MSNEPLKRYFYRCFSKRSAGALKCGQNRVGPPLLKPELLLQFERHSILENQKPTALVSVGDRLIEALHHAFVKYYNRHERAGDIWIAIISNSAGGNETSPYHHAEKLAHELGKSPKDSRKFKHEYVFEWEIPDQYVEHMVSVETLLDRGLNLDSYLEGDHLPDLRGFRSSMIDMFLGDDGLCVGRELGRMARCFGARAPVKEIANSILTDCPICISFDGETQYVEWTTTYESDTDAYTFAYIDFEYFYWISQGITEALFDLWLADAFFLGKYIVHVEWANDLTAEMEILWELYSDNRHYEGWAAVDSDCIADDARELEMRECEIHDLIERDALSIGL
ncbi:uncharacterized protein BDW43DRAFT_311995 [Aspergillus alliaceus]|uniref:uncharacterized protein n=1 Tax=Petromyces alliaceus TaxID=209559 RepID=UPI0012A46962|nr:uncharacterized protein BDW43DRAFT_311995 [Aspergillus alliaceus]KAB8232610.1 hypothetical protein BDW43DRAFT_311995 [Aspergillus alliaceus]